MDNSIKYFAYLRKSTDSEDRQIQSIEDQQKELDRLSNQLGLKIVGTFKENMSAKAPGRTEFNKMMAEIKKGKASGIVCWKLNRLSRNPVDGGEIMWLIQQGILQSVQTPGREYKTGDNVIIMSVELGMANQFILDLSKDVKRGLHSKAEKGWRPGRAPLGYINEKYEEKGNKKVLPDVQKFPLVRKMWDLMMTGNYTIPQIIDIANEKLGLRTTSKKNEIKLSIRHGYKIFTNPFYYGEFNYAGKLYEGTHQAMITFEEYDHVQKMLGKKGNHRPKTKALPFNGFIRCGECGCSITAYEKVKHNKATNSIKSYIYHRCTKRKAGVRCYQDQITSIEMQNQVDQILDKITIPKSFLGYAIEVLNEENIKESANRNTLIKNQQRALSECVKKIDNLIKLYISSGNIDRELISDEEFKEQKSALMKEKAAVQRELKNLDERVNEWIELTERTFKFATYAKYWFSKADYSGKTTILRSLGLNFVLKDGKMAISLAKPYLIIKDGLEKIHVENATLELSDLALDKAKTGVLAPVFTTVSG